MAKPISVSRPTAEVLVNDYVRSVYNWMCIGLALTGFVAFYVSTNETLLRLVFSNSIIFFGLIIAQLALVFAIVGRVTRMSAGTATALFVVYATLNGVLFSFIFRAYTTASIFRPKPKARSMTSRSPTSTYVLTGTHPLGVTCILSTFWTRSVFCWRARSAI